MLSLSAIEFALRRSDPLLLVNSAARLRGSVLTLKDIRDKTIRLDVGSYESIYIVGAGKATAKMAEGLCKILRKRISGGAINVPYDRSNFETRALITDLHVAMTEAGHPLPDEAGMRGAITIVDLLKKTTKSDLVFCLLSGGGSALLPLPLEGISLEDKQKITNEMLSVGATINEVNVIRKHLSRVKGGRLIRFVNKSCTVIGLVMSDVIGDNMDIIASGPTVPDNSTFQDALNILKKYGLWQRTGRPFTSIRRLIMNGLRGRVQDTPKVNDPIFKDVHNLLIGNNSILCGYAIEYLKKRVKKVKNLGSSFGGEAKEFGYFLANMSQKAISSPKSIAIVMGGETTVNLNSTLRRGIGGRNQEAVLSVVQKCYFQQGVDFSLCCMGTDGIDGNSIAAGAIVTPRTSSRIKETRMNVNEYLYTHDSYSALRKLRSLIITGRTGTNLNDITIICKVA
jgi:glycerate-2-kinase